MQAEPISARWRRLSWVLLLAVATGLTGCAFNRDYQKALAQSVAPDSIEGAWRGRWLSDRNGHHGDLRGIITRLEGNTYRTRFKARFWKLFTYTSEAEFEMQPHNDGYEFSGTKKLGWLAGGEYFYEGRVRPDQFFSTYQNKWDEGTFEMTRPEPVP